MGGLTAVCYKSYASEQENFEDYSFYHTLWHFISSGTVALYFLYFRKIPLNR
eukprot:UN15793